VTRVAARHGIESENGRLLKLECGTGEHTRRLATAGVDVECHDGYGLGDDRTVLVGVA
jgi:hypothetical protein